MSATRRGSWLVPLLGGLWAAAMSVLGFMALIDGPGPLPIPPEFFWFLGLSGVAGGQFVFMVLVADRCFPHASRRLIVMGEGTALGVFVVGTLLTVVLLSSGAAW